jgi:hydrogenase/urease accessory protein HupE
VSGRIGRAIAWMLAASCLLGGTAATAHEMTMAEMEIRETAAGEFLWHWTARQRPGPNELVPRWPEGCTAADANRVTCGPGGFVGSFSVDGVGKGYSAALVRIAWLDGGTRVYTLTAGQPSVRLHGAADDRRGALEIANAYFLLGVEHILAGIDHLLFVVGLLFLVGFRKKLVWTITAFTVAHSLTLASAALGWLTLRSAPVEACIALSIVLVAAEALRDRQTLARRLPALVAFLFGLVHGLGFAGALQEIGLPQNHLLIALVTFNLGVEAGQLLAVGAAACVAFLLARFRWAPRLQAPALYAIGSIAAYWTLTRVAGIGMA